MKRQPTERPTVWETPQEDIEKEAVREEKYDNKRQKEEGNRERKEEEEGRQIETQENEGEERSMQGWHSESDVDSEEYEEKKNSTIEEDEGKKRGNWKNVKNSRAIDWILEFAGQMEEFLQ